MNVPREEFGLVCGPTSAGGSLKLYAIGGYNSKDLCLTSVECYDFASKTWTPVASLERPTKALGAVALPDWIYVLGGFDGSTLRYSADVHRFDCVTNRWHQVSSMRFERGAFAVAALSTCDYIYVVGGFGQDGCPTEKVERYSVAQDTWESVAPLHSKRFMHTACFTTIMTDNGRLY